MDIILILSIKNYAFETQIKINLYLEVLNHCFHQEMSNG